PSEQVKPRPFHRFWAPPRGMAARAPSLQLPDRNKAASLTFPFRPPIMAPESDKVPPVAARTAAPVPAGLLSPHFPKGPPMGQLSSPRVRVTGRRWRVWYRPWLEALEPRLPPDDALPGVLAGGVLQEPAFLDPEAALSTLGFGGADQRPPP